MDARIYLASIREAEKRLQLKSEQIRRLRESLTNISVPTDKEYVTHTKNVAAMSRTVARIVDMEHEMDHQAEEMVNLRQEALSYFDQLNPDYARVLTDRYVNGLRVTELSREYNYGRRNIYRIINLAIDDLQILFDKLDAEKSPSAL